VPLDVDRCWQDS